MKKRLIPTIPTPYDRNGGQRAEYLARLAYTGETCKPDNKRAEDAPDMEANGIRYQIKSARASIAYGEPATYIRETCADLFLYITKAGEAYEMTPAEWLEFVKQFATLTADSRKNGGREKWRLGHETRALLAYLHARA